MHMYGIIHDVNLKDKLISLEKHDRVKYYYLQNSLMKTFKKYLYKGNYISFVYSEEEETQKGKVFAYKVLYIEKIFVPGKYCPDVFYDKESINKSLVSFLTNLDNLLFIDLEMTMPDYNSSHQNFKAEIIQAGLVLVQNNGVILKQNFYVKPTKRKKISKRTKDFLSISEEKLSENGISYYKFYNIFKQLINKYHPAIVVWGKNDKIFLENSFMINKLPSLSFLCRFINLNQLVKNFYELKIDPGLFRMYEYYFQIKLETQRHDALEDAMVTYNVFEAFKEAVLKGDTTLCEDDAVRLLD